MIDTAHAFRRDAEDVADAIDHVEAHGPLYVNLATPESDSLVEHLRDMCSLGAPPEMRLAFKATIRRLAGHSLAAVALGRPAADRLHVRATRARNLQLNGGRRGWSIRRRADALRVPLEVLCDPDSPELLAALALSVVERMGELLPAEDLLDPAVLRSLGKKKGSKLLELAAGEHPETSDAAAGNGDVAGNHEDRRVLHTGL
jgi:hypothetical protein